MSGSSTDKIKITEEIIAHIRSEIERTGCGPTLLLRGQRTKKPEGLSSDVITRWLNGNSKTGYAAHLDFVLALWEALPDENEAYVRLTPKHRKELKQKLKDTGASPRKLFSERDDMPEGFNWKHVHNMLSSSNKKLTKDNYAYLIKVFDEHQGKGYIELTDEIREKIKDEIERTGLSILRLSNRTQIKTSYLS